MPGLTLPGRWRRSQEDAEVAADLGAAVRVVKGQWAGEPDVDPRAGFMEVVKRLAGRIPGVQVATHDAPLAESALARLGGTSTAAELELLFGLPLAEPARVARRAGVPVRIYVPYGHGWLPYAAKQALRRPRTLLWLTRDLLSAPARERFARELSG